MSKLVSVILLFCFFFSCVGVSKKRLAEIDESIRDVAVDIYKPLFSDALIFDVTSDGDFTNEDLMKCLYISASELKHKSFDKIYLSRKGEKIYYIDGNYFGQFGRDLKPTEDKREFISRIPENTYKLDGIHAFPSSQAGWVLVESQRMEYVDDLLNELRK